MMVGRGAEEEGRPLLRPVLARLGDPRDRRPAAPGLPDALLLGGRVQAQHADRPALPARLHRQVRRALRRAGHGGGAPRDRRGLLLVHRRPDQPARQAARARDAGRQPTRPSTSGPPGCATTSARSQQGHGAERRRAAPTAPTPTSIAVAEDPLEIAVQVFYVRGGRVRGQRGWVADRVDDAELPELLAPLPHPGLRRRGAPTAIPREVLVPEPPDDVDVVTDWLSDKRGSKVSLRVPQRGDKRTLMETVARNASQSLALHKTRRASDLTTRSRALEEIQEALELAEAPLRIECYDVSNLQGTEVVASMVVFEDGLPRKSDYRRFVIKRRRGPERRRRDARDHHPPVPAAARRAGRVAPGSTSARPSRGARPGPDRPRHRPARASSPTRRAWSSSTAARRRSPPRSAPSTSSASTTSRSSGWPSGSRRSGGRAAATRSSCRARARASTCCSGSATRRTGSRSPTTATGVRRAWSRACSTRCPDSARSGARCCCATSAR